MASEEVTRVASEEVMREAMLPLSGTVFTYDWHIAQCHEGLFDLIQESENQLN